MNQHNGTQNDSVLCCETRVCVCKTQEQLKSRSITVASFGKWIISGIDCDIFNVHTSVNGNSVL
jgi:hypothetical protein